MNKLKLVTELQAIESRKEDFEKQLKAVKSDYFKNGTVTLTIETSDFTEKGIDTPIVFSKFTMVSYLQSEIQTLQSQSDEIIKELSFKVTALQ